MVVNGLSCSQGRICVVGNVGQIVVLVCDLDEEAAEGMHARHGHDLGRDVVHLAFSTLGYVDRVGMVLEVVGDGVALTVLDLAEMVELDLCLMVGDRGILGAMDSIAFLLDCVQ